MKTQKNVIPLSFLEIILQFTAIKSFVCYWTLYKIIYKLIMSRVLAFILLHMVRRGYRINFMWRSTSIPLLLYLVSSLHLVAFGEFAGVLIGTWAVFQSTNNNNNFKLTDFEFTLWKIEIHTGRYFLQLALLSMITRCEWHI